MAPINNGSEGNPLFDILRDAKGRKMEGIRNTLLLLKIIKVGVIRNFSIFYLPQFLTV